MDLVAVGQAAVMGVVEGLTEFLPVSSTGHLIAVGRLIGFEGVKGDAFAQMFEIVIQLGAILAVCWYFRARLWKLVRGIASGEEAERRFALALLVAFIPTAVIALALHRVVEAHLMRPEVVAATLALGGFAILWIERRVVQPIHHQADNLPWRVQIGIGLCQSLAAVLPGTSRSGATIMGSLLMGVDRRAATEFSFFLAIPTMFAATGYDLLKHRHDLTGDGLELIVVGFVVSFVVALAVVAWLLRFVAGHTFVAFGWYRILAGLILAGWCAWSAFGG
jgi:undecaprenyl-diphosphatase